MIFIDWMNIIVGALIGFGLSELSQYFFRIKKKIKLSNHFSNYSGLYSQKTKAGKELQDKVEIGYEKNNILRLTFFSRINGKAEGHAIMDESTLKYGKVFYRHIDPGKEHLSGFYDIILFKPGLIHAKVSYIKADTTEEINQLYIWSREEK